MEAPTARCFRRQLRSGATLKRRASSAPPVAAAGWSRRYSATGPTASRSEQLCVNTAKINWRVACLLKRIIKMELRFTRLFSKRGILEVMALLTKWYVCDSQAALSNTS